MTRENEPSREGMSGAAAARDDGASPATGRRPAPRGVSGPAAPPACPGPRPPGVGYAAAGRFRSPGSPELMEVSDMETLEVTEGYFAAWNSRDPEAVAAAFADGGTYLDPAS